MRRVLAFFLLATFLAWSAEAKPAREDKPLEASGQIEVQAEWGEGKKDPRTSFEAEALVPLTGRDSGLVFLAEGEGLPRNEARFRGLAGWQQGLVKDLTLGLVAGVEGLTDNDSGSRILVRWGTSLALDAQVAGFQFESSALALGGRDTERSAADVVDLEAQGEASWKWPLSGRWDVATGVAAKVGWSAGLEPAAWSDKKELFLDLGWGPRFTSRWSPLILEGARGSWSAEVRVGPSESNLRFLVGADWTGGGAKAEIRWKEKF